ncbi:MAG: hypothetical protein RL662_1484, partial [Bacteroidota bacterium]
NIIYSETKQVFEHLNISSSELAIILKVKEKEYPYLNELFEWGNALKKFSFTNQFEKNRLLKPEEVQNSQMYEGINANNVLKLFDKGKRAFGTSFEEAVINDMKCLHYDIENICLETTKNGISLSVKEVDLPDTTTQIEMSQGMFRALAFLIQLNYALSSKASVCLLVDDLGEGLDYSRSKALIDILIYKINNSDIQAFITTNDRYVMNTIPLKYWSILERKHKSSIIYNYGNSKTIFDDFKYTGLNNFDFLATDFFIHGFENKEEE